MLRNHPIVLAALLMLCFATAAAAKHHDEDFTLTANVLESNSSAAAIPNDNYSINCQSNGDQTNCTGRGGGVRQHTAIVQLVEMSDGMTYELQCRMGYGRGFASGFAAGTGANTVSGCMTRPGTYQARKDRRGFVLRYMDSEGKEHQRAFDIVSVRVRKLAQQ